MDLYSRPYNPHAPLRMRFRGGQSSLKSSDYIYDKLERKFATVAHTGSYIYIDVRNSAE